MHDDLGNEVKEYVSEELSSVNVYTLSLKKMTYLLGETEGSPIMPVLHNLKHVPLEINLSIKEFIMELLHRQFLSGLCVLSQFTVLQIDIMINGFTGEWDFFIDPLTDSRHDCPVPNSDWDTSKET